MKKVISRNILFICILVTVWAVALPMGVGSAQALNYGGVEMSSLWYYGDSGLKIDSAKAVIDGWNKGALSQKIIAVIDTGIDYKHEVFDGVLYEKDGKPVGYDARANSAKAKQEVSLDDMADNAYAVDKNGNPTEIQKHGNAIAGVIAIMIKELGLQDYIKIYPIKANTINDKKVEIASFRVENAVEAINQAKRIGADAINLSLGLLKQDEKRGDNTWSNSAELKYALESASADSFIVAAAGNDGKNSDESDEYLFYPAAHDGVFGVMAYTESGLYADSNYGSAYDIAAPGEHIYTAKYADSNTYNNDMNGTSLATPIAALAGTLVQLRFEAEGKTAVKGNNVARLMRNLDCRTVKKGNNEIKCLDFNTVVTQDFSNTEFKYDAPTELTISHDGAYGKDVYDETIYMRANDVKPITFIAKLSPFGKTDPALEQAIEWIVRRADSSETSMGRGVQFVYTPTYIDEVVTVIARLQYGDKLFEQIEDVFLSSVEFMVGDARVTYKKNAAQGVNGAPSRGVVYTGETTVFTLTGIEYIGKKASKISWYVDGEYVGSGATFEYSPKTTGVHLISAKYDDSPIPREFTATVKPFIARPLDLSMLIIGLVIAVAVISVVTVICVRRNKNKKLAIGDAKQSEAENAEALKEETKE